MINIMINIPQKNFKSLSTSLISLLFLFFIFLPQVAGAVMYAPGETLEPACGPTDSNCGVTTPVYTSDTLSDGGLLFASSSAWSLLPAGSDGQVLKLSGGLPTWGNDDGGTSYTAGSGLSLTGSSFALDLTNANNWSGLQTFASGFSLGGNTYTNLAGTGLSFSGGTLSTALGTTVESSEITDGTIVAADIADSTITFGKIASNSCGDNQIMKWNGSAWACSVDNNDTYTASAGLSLSSGAFSLDINGLSAVSSINATDTIAVYTANGLKKITRSDMFSDVLGAMNYRGTWNATTNSPNLSSYCDSGTKGHYYVVGTSGTTNLSGITSWAVNDWAVCNGTSWEKVQTTNAVTSVFGRTGAVVASGGDYNASQVTNTPSGAIAAVTVQNALNELDSEKLGTTLNSGLIFVGNASNQATGVALSGDATIDNSGVLTIGADKVTLGTDTTGNYVATLADSGAGVFTVANSGSENASVTLALVDDILDFSKFADALTLDNSTSITLAGNDLTFAITGAGLPKFTRTSAGQWMNFADGTDTFGIFNRAGTPEGSIAADKGSLAIDTTNGALYIKTTDSLNTGWSAFGLSSSGVTSLNGLTGNAQTFATGTSGTDFNISSSGTTHTFNIPDASATARGLVTTGAQTIAGAKTFSSAIIAPTSSNTINGLIINSGALSGISTLSMSGAITSATSGNTINGLIINSGALSGITGITMTSGNLDMANGLITNIGNAGTDFTSGGGLNLAGDLAINTNKFNITSSSGNTTVAGTLNVTGLVTGASGFSAASGGLELANSTPGDVTNKLYNSNGTLYWNNSAIGQTLAASYLFAGLSADQTSNLSGSNNDHIKFNEVITSYGSDISLDSSSTYSTTDNTDSIGRFTLEAGKTYKLTAAIRGYSYVAGYIKMAWYNADSGTQIGSGLTSLTATYGSNYDSNNQAVAIFTPATDTRVELRINYNSSFTTIYADDNNSYYTNATYALIETIAGNTPTAITSVDITDNLADGYIIKQGSDNYLKIDTTNGLESITLGNSTINPDFIFTGTGNVGIGTTTPSQLLSLASATSGGIEIAAPSETAIYFTDTNGDDSWKIYKTSSGSIIFKDVTEGINVITIGADSGHGVSFSGGISSLGDISSSNDVLVGDNLYVSGPDSYSGNYYPCWSDSSGAGYIGRCSSDERLKGNINYLNDNLLEKVLALKPATYQNKLRGEEGEVLDGLADGLIAGFIAQDVQALFPEAVGFNESDGFLTFSPQNLVPYLVKAIQEQQGQIETLKAGSAVSLTGLDNLVLSGGLAIAGEVDMGKDTVGEAVIKTGATSVSVSFEKKYINQPVITATAEDFIDGNYRITEKTTKGFRIELSQAQTKDISFDWHAFGARGGVRLFSDGLKENIEVVDLDVSVEQEVSLPERTTEIPSVQSDNNSLADLKQEADEQTGDIPVTDDNILAESENSETSKDTKESIESENQTEAETPTEPVAENSALTEPSAPDGTEAPAETSNSSATSGE
jgi:hypothetical protein